MHCNPPDEARRQDGEARRVAAIHNDSSWICHGVVVDELRWRELACSLAVVLTDLVSRVIDVVHRFARSGSAEGCRDKQRLHQRHFCYL